MTTPLPKPRFLPLLALVATVLLALIVAPFAGSLFAAAVLAGVLYPAQSRLQHWLGDRPGLAAGALTICVSTLAVAPLAILCLYAARVLTGLYRSVRAELDSGGVEALIESIPTSLQGVSRSVLELLPGDVSSASGTDRVEGSLLLSGNELETAAGLATETFDTLIGLLIDLGVLIVALFFLLSQGRRLVGWIVSVLPLSREQSHSLVGELRDVTRAVFAATIATAFLQTSIAAVGYWIAGVPYLTAVLLLTLIASLIPVVGGAAIVCAVGLLYLLTGDIGNGVFLLIWGVLPVGLSDNLAKPWLAQGATQLPGAVVLFAMIGGVAVFGPMGIVAGPLIVALFTATLGLLREEHLAPSA